VTIAIEAGGVVSLKKTPLKGPELRHMPSQAFLSLCDAKVVAGCAKARTWRR
jgi:hypothetical protein